MSQLAIDTDMTGPVEGVIAQRNPRARRLRLRLDVKRRQVVLVVPRGCSMGEAWRFAAANRGWVEGVLAGLPVPVDHGAGDCLQVLGQDWRLVVCDRAKRLSERDGALVLPVEEAADRALRLRRWVMAQARRGLPGLLDAPLTRLEALNAKAAGRYQRFRLSTAGTRWGSCSGRGTVSLNWRLALAPRDVAEYVAAHEVAHLKHMDHSADFWALCAALHGADIEAPRQWLRENGQSLMAGWV